MRVLFPDLDIFDQVAAGPALAVVYFGAVTASALIVPWFALEAIGADTPKGRGFADRWRYPSFRHAFRVVTVVLGPAFELVALCGLAWWQKRAPRGQSVQMMDCPSVSRREASR